jgi:hypothetical protein
MFIRVRITLLASIEPIVSRGGGVWELQVELLGSKGLVGELWGGFV